MSVHDDVTYRGVKYRVEMTHDPNESWWKLEFPYQVKIFDPEIETKPFLIYDGELAFDIYAFRWSAIYFTRRKCRRLARIKLANRNKTVEHWTYEAEALE